jgi:cupin
MDVLSDVLRAVRLTGAVYFDIDAGSPWIGESPRTAEIAAAVMPGAEHVVSFHAILSGSCWAAATDSVAPPVLLNAGDLVIFPGGAPNVMSSSPGVRGDPDMAMYYRPIDKNLPFALIRGGEGNDRTRFACGYLGCDARPFNPLLAALPAMLCVRASQSTGADG